MYPTQSCMYCLVYDIFAHGILVVDASCLSLTIEQEMTPLRTAFGSSTYSCRQFSLTSVNLPRSIQDCRVLDMKTCVTSTCFGWNNLLSMWLNILTMKNQQRNSAMNQSRGVAEISRREVLRSLLGGIALKTIIVSLDWLINQRTVLNHYVMLTLICTIFLAQ